MLLSAFLRVQRKQKRVTELREIFTGWKYFLTFCRKPAARRRSHDNVSDANCAFSANRESKSSLRWSRSTKRAGMLPNYCGCRKSARNRRLSVLNKDIDWAIDDRFNCRQMRSRIDGLAWMNERFSTELNAAQLWMLWLQKSLARDENISLNWLQLASVSRHLSLGLRACEFSWKVLGFWARVEVIIFFLNNLLAHLSATHGV